MKKERDVTFDFLKSIAIFLVILGHSMATGPENVYHNINGRWIVMMNMPLFMFIVGFFSLSSIKRGFREMLTNKWHTLLIPTLVYGVITSLPRILAHNTLNDSELMVG